jgi:hypothetical protein
LVCGLAQRIRGSLGKVLFLLRLLCPVLGIDLSQTVVVERQPPSHGHSREE